ncbi:MAG: hypothetical protein ACOYMZ_01020 [Minisyncoccia bacterium]
MKLIHYRLIALGLALGIAGAVSAYTPPTTGAFGANTDAPINTSALSQDKAGGFSTTTFQARGNALFSQETFAGGVVTGGNIQSDGSNTVAIGNSSYGVNTTINGSISTLGTIQSNSLVSGGGKKPVCANADGTFFLCTSPSTAPAAPAPVAATPSASLDFYIEGSQQTGTFVMVNNNNDGSLHRLDMAPGFTMGISTGKVVPIGSYTITNTDIVCTTTNDPVMTRGGGTDFVLNDGDSYTITFNFSC